MAYRQRTSRVIAQRHDLNHFKYTPGLRRWQGYLTLAALLLVVAGLVLAARRGAATLFGAGPMSSPHALLASNCAACHSTAMNGAGATLRRAGFRRKVMDSACLACHVAPAHLAGMTVQAAFTPECSSCHVEHVGSTHLSQTADQNCTECHADLSAAHGNVTVGAHIRSFTDGHPEFAMVRSGALNEEHIRFNHAAHLQAGLVGPDGTARVQMTCNDCHRSFAVISAGSRFRFAAALQAGDELPAAKFDSALHPPPSGRASMAPVAFQQSCRACHNLQFDFFTRAEAPHAAPQAVHTFVQQQIQTFAVQHPDAVTADIRQLALTRPTLVPGHPDQPLQLPKNNAEWVRWRVAYSEQILSKKCQLCHEVNGSAAETSAMPAPGQQYSYGMPQLAPQAVTLPELLPTNQRVRYFQNAVFSHSAHESFTCESCHTKARSSVEPTDMLLPGIASCRKCHNGRPEPQNTPVAAGHAQSGCFLCHQYHRWDAWRGEQPPHPAPTEQAGMEAGSN